MSKTRSQMLYLVVLSHSVEITENTASEMAWYHMYRTHQVPLPTAVKQTFGQRWIHLCGQ